MSTATRPRPSWHPPPPRTPKILNIPRRIHRKPTKPTKPTNPITGAQKPFPGNENESLFDQERAFFAPDERRQRVQVLEEFEFNRDREFEPEILRAECNFLRMERDIAVKKLELNRLQTKITLRSAVQTLVSGKEKIHQGRSCVLEEEIGDLEERLKELQRKSFRVRDFEFRKYSSNFDKQASVLQRKLEKLRQEEEEESVEMLKRKMERLSKGMLENCGSGTNSGSASFRRIDFPFLATSTHVQSLKLQDLKCQEMKLNEGKTCSGRCKKIVRKVVEQVRAEMEQCSQMQEMLERVKQEMEDLQISRDSWQDRALDSDDQIQSLQFSVQEWKQKAKYSETKVIELEKHISELHIEIGRLKDKHKKESGRVLQEAQKEKEKRVLICRLKENHDRSGNENKNKVWDNDKRRNGHDYGSGSIPPKRSPFRDIQNLSPPSHWESRINVPFAMS